MLFEMEWIGDENPGLYMVVGLGYFRATRVCLSCGGLAGSEGRIQATWIISGYV